MKTTQTETATAEKCIYCGALGSTNDACACPSCSAEMGLDAPVVAKRRCLGCGEFTAQRGLVYFDGIDWIGGAAGLALAEAADREAEARCRAAKPYRVSVETLAAMGPMTTSQTYHADAWEDGHLYSD